MDFDSVVTDAAGLVVIVIGLVSLTEALLQVEIVGDSMPLMQGTVVSLFAVSFGAVLLTENASTAFRKIRSVFQETVAD